MKEVAKKMGERLKTARKDAKLSRQALADALGNTHASISRWEDGGLIPAYALPIIAKMTNRPIEYFLLEDSELSETKLQTATKLAQMIDLKDSEIDQLKARISELEKVAKPLEDLKKLGEELKKDKETA